MKFMQNREGFKAVNNMFIDAEGFRIKALNFLNFGGPYDEKYALERADLIALIDDMVIELGKAKETITNINK